MRNSGGPRQPGGGSRQTAGPRDHARARRQSDRPHREGREKPAGKGKPAARGRAPAGPAHGRGRNKRPPLGERRIAAAPVRLVAPEVEAAPLPELPTAVQTVTITPDEANMRIDRFLEARFPGLSFSHIQRIVRKGELRVNGKRVDSKDRLQAGQAVRIPPLKLDPAKPRSPATEADEKTRAFLKSITLYEDADLIVFNKPMGLAVQGGSGTTRHLDGMLDVLREPGRDGQRPRLVHRLDKDTAGCLLVAKSRFAAAALAKTFRSRSARKIYWALVAGVPKPKQGRISTFLAKEEREDDSFMRIAKHGEDGASHAVTYYAVVETSAQTLAWLSLKPVTGRTHQLRAHMAHIGYPIVGDPKYFSKENWELPGGIQNRLHLLAHRIAVPHPRGGVVDVTAPLPPHMEQSWNLLGLDIKRYDPIDDAPEE
jgi:23S rRNA pseudouridine955/2504/2580 synthase